MTLNSKDNDDNMHVVISSDAAGVRAEARYGFTTVIRSVDFSILLENRVNA